MDYSQPILNRNTWGIHINSARYIHPPPVYPVWLNSFQKRVWQERGVVVWDFNNQEVTRIYAGRALKILTHLTQTDTWKTGGFILGSPAYQIPIPEEKRKKLFEETSIEMPKAGWVLTNQIELSPGQSAELLKFLISAEDLLKQVAADENREACETLSKVYELLVEDGRKRRETKETGKREETLEKKIVPTLVPKGNYFTVSQIAEMCNVTTRHVKKWIRTGNFEAVDLPGLGMIIEAGKLDKFLNEKGIRH